MFIHLPVVLTVPSTYYISLWCLLYHLLTTFPCSAYCTIYLLHFPVVLTVPSTYYVSLWCLLYHLLMQTSFEANADLYAARRRHFETSLDYYSEVNGFQLKRKFSLMEPLLTFMHAQVKLQFVNQLASNIYIMYMHMYYIYIHTCTMYDR